MVANILHSQFANSEYRYDVRTPAFFSHLCFYFIAAKYTLILDI